MIIFYVSPNPIAESRFVYLANSKWLAVFLDQ